MSRPTFSTILLIIILLLFIGLSLILSLSIPLGESADEIAHFQYLQFVAHHGRLPTTAAEQVEAGYRSNWPGLYQLLVAPVIALTEGDGPTELKVIGANPRRLLVFDGFGGMSVLPTDDEAWPFQGIVRAWHAARLVSIVFSVAALLLIYDVLRRLFSTSVSLAGLAILTLIPRFLMMSAVLNDDSLLGLLVALFLWLLWPLLHHEGSWGRYLALGSVAGLAISTKYSALFMPLDLLLVLGLLTRRPAWSKIGLFCLGLLVGAGWWFGFVIYHFHQIETLGWLRGSLAPFLAGGTDVSTRRVATLFAADTLAAPLATTVSTDWGNWLRALFVTFWFPGSTSPGWWVPLAALLVFSGGGMIYAIRRQIVSKPVVILLITHSLLFVPLLVLRFYLTGNIAETAQGRHLLFPVLLPLALLLLAGILGWERVGLIPARMTLSGVALFLLTSLAVSAWPAMTFPDQPYLPVQTDFVGEPQRAIKQSYRGQITLLGLDEVPPDTFQKDVLPITLVWQVKTTPSDDYRIGLTLLDVHNRPIGRWLGQPVNGRYPTRAWESGDVVHDLVRIPTLPGRRPAIDHLEIEVWDASAQLIRPDEAADPVIIVNGLMRPSQTTVASWATADEADFSFTLVPRSDRLGSDQPYRDRSTIALVTLPWPNTIADVSLRDPSGNFYPPADQINDETGHILLFQVDWRWPTGVYDLVARNDRQEVIETRAEVVSIQNNKRLTEVPAISHLVQANFGDQLALVGYDLPVNRVQPGDNFEVTLVWQALALMNTDYKVFNHLLDVDQIQRGGRDRQPQNFYSTLLWKAGEVVIDRYPVPVAPDAPDGIYWLDVGLYPTNDPTRSPLPLIHDHQPAKANSVRLGPVKVGGQPAVSKPQSMPQTERSDRFGALIQLNGYNLTYQPEQKQLRLGLYWSVLEPPPLDYTLFIHIVDQNGQLVAQSDGPPVSGLYPTSFWDFGEMIFDQRQVSLTEVEAESVQIRLGWYDPNSGMRLSVVDNPEGFIQLTTLELK